MVRTLACFTKTTLCSRGSSSSKKLMRHFTSKVGSSSEDKTSTVVVDYNSSNYVIAKCEDENETVPYWMPEARTGIYVPKGHEGVIQDVPENAASFKHSFWLRNVDGVDNHYNRNYIEDY